MITTPYATLRKALGKEPEWHPTWAQHLEVRREAGVTVYTAQPHTLTADDVTDLATVQGTGWRVAIDAPRLNKIRVKIWR